MKGTLDIHRELLARDVPHEVIRLPRLVLDADELPEVLDLPPARCVAVRIYQMDEQLVAVIVRAGDVPDPARLLNLLRARSVRVAPADLINAATDYASGLVAPLLLPPEMVVVADAAILESPVLYAPTGETGTALGIPARALVETAGATVAELCVGDSVLDVTDVEQALAQHGSGREAVADEAPEELSLRWF